MLDANMEYLKRKIKRTYKWYTKERTDGEATLADIAKFFNIDVDSSREEDYELKSIDLQNYSIEIFDKKYATTYKSHYTNYADLLSSSASDTIYNRVEMVTALAKIDSLYYIGNEKPIITIMSFNNENYTLNFEREGENNIVRYCMDLLVDGRIFDQRLLTKIYNVNGNYDFKQIYTYNYIDRIETNDKQDKYAYLYPDNLIYGVSEREEKGRYGSRIHALFSEGKSSRKTYPLSMFPEDFPLLEVDTTLASIVVFGLTFPNEEGSIFNKLEVYKEADKINIKYTTNTRNYEDNKNEPECNEVVLPVLHEGKFSLDELSVISETLADLYSDNEFIDITLEELDNFISEISIRNGLEKDEEGILNPRNIQDKSFKEIYELVEANKDEYFKLISDQFYEATHFSKTEDQTRILKPENN